YRLPLLHTPGGCAGGDIPVFAVWMYIQPAKPRGLKRRQLPHGCQTAVAPDRLGSCVVGDFYVIFFKVFLGTRVQWHGESLSCILYRDIFSCRMGIVDASRLSKKVSVMSYTASSLSSELAI